MKWWDNKWEDYNRCEVAQAEYVPCKMPVLTENISKRLLLCHTFSSVCLWSCTQNKNFFLKRLLYSISPLSPSHQVRKTSEYSPLPATFAHWPHSSPETQYLTTDKQLTHLFFWGTRWLAPSPTLASLTARGPAETETKRDNLVVKPQTAIKLLYFTIRITVSWLSLIHTLCVFLSNSSNFWHALLGHPSL